MRRILLLVETVIGAFLLAGCTASPRFTSIKYPTSRSVEGSIVEEGIASYYAEEFHGRKTSSGEIYDMNAMTAAHPSLPFNTMVKVTNLENGMSTIVRINDRGPFKDMRIIDLSYAAAKAISMIGSGTARVKLEVIK